MLGTNKVVVDVLVVVGFSFANEPISSVLFLSFTCIVPPSISEPRFEDL